MHSSSTLHFLLSVLPPFPCHFSPMKYWQGSHLFLPCSSTVPRVFWPQRRSPLAHQHCPLITALRVLVPQAQSSPWLKVSIILFIRLRERREGEILSNEHREEEEEGWSASLHPLFTKTLLFPFFLIELLSPCKRVLLQFNEIV